MRVYSIGVDLGGTNLRIAAVDSDGKLREKLTTGTEVQRGRDHVIGEMCEAISRSVSSFGTRHNWPASESAYPDSSTWTRNRYALANLPDWMNFPVAGTDRGQTGTTVILRTMLTQPRWAKKWLGAGRNANNMAMYTLGTGVGGGLVFNGRLWHGMSGMAGELGHMNVEPEGHPCGCGSRGCLEQYASATAIVRMAHEAIASGNAPDLAEGARGNVEFTARGVYSSPSKACAAAESSETVGRAMAIGVGGVVNALNLPCT